MLTSEIPARKLDTLFFPAQIECMHPALGSRIVVTRIVVMTSVCGGLSLAAQESGSFFEGMSRDEARSILGTPMTAHRTGDQEQWIYETPQGSVTIRFMNGRASLRLPLMDHSHFLVSSNPDVLYEKAREFAGTGKIHDAAVHVEKCLEANQRHRKCAKLRGEILPPYVADLDTRLRQVAGTDHSTRKSILEQMFEISSGSEKIRNALLLENQNIEIRSRAAVSSLIHAREAGTQAREAVSRNDFPAAAAALAPFQEFRLIAPAIYEFRRVATEHYRGELSRSKTLDELETKLREIDGLPVGLSEVQKTEVLSQAQTVAIQHLRRVKPIVHTPGHVRAYEATLNRAYPRVFSDVKLWAQVGGQTHVKSNIRTETPEACLETRAVFHNPSILTNARVSFGHADSAEIQIKLSFDCDVSTIVSEPYPINSTYVSGYQQIVNSDYVTLQWELQQAQSEVADLKRRHAANPPVNGWLAAAYGLAEGLAQGKVNKISQKLRQTSPYLSEPIKLAYAAEGYGATRSARLSVAIQLHDSKTMFDDAIYLSATSESSDTGTMNVLPSDAQGLVNRQPSLKEDRVLLEESFAKFQSHMDAAARDLLARAFIDRARGSVKDHVALVGNLLLARDVMPESIDSLNANAILERLSGSNLNELTAMKIDATTIRFPPRSPTKNAETAPAKPSTSVRSAAIEKALASVVTVRTPSGFGTGFFANDRGFIITNLHVVRGPGKVTVHTRDGSTFLATVVKSSENPDLALIKISGFTAPPLSVADSDNVEVGSDVLAVGSPKGLEGSVTKGIISARRKIEGVRYFQVDAAINPGNSGGPLLNENGQVIGINTAKRSEGESLGFAIEINEARALFSEFLEN